MNIATGVLVLIGFCMVLLGISSKLMGVSLLDPFVMKYSNYFLLGITAFVMALVIEKFEKE